MIGCMYYMSRVALPIESVKKPKLYWTCEDHRFINFRSFHSITVLKDPRVEQNDPFFVRFWSFVLLTYARVIGFKWTTGPRAQLFQNITPNRRYLFTILLIYCVTIFRVPINSHKLLDRLLQQSRNPTYCLHWKVGAIHWNDGLSFLAH